MRYLIVLFFAVSLAACDLFSAPDNRSPQIMWARLFAVDTVDVFAVRMQVGAIDPDGNLDGLDCTGDLNYNGPSPVDTTVTFPFSQQGEEVFSNCFATDTEGAVSQTLRLFTFLPQRD